MQPLGWDLSESPHTHGKMAHLSGKGAHICGKKAHASEKRIPHMQEEVTYPGFEHWAAR